jgi:hypothetical protein
VSLKNRIGSFLLLAGAIFLFIFVASALAPAESGGPALLPLAGGAVLLFVGTRWRLDKKGRPTGPPPGPPPGAAPAGAPPKKRGPMAAFAKRSAAKGGPPAGGGGKPAGGKPGGPPGGGASKGAKAGGGPPGSAKPKKK